MSVNRQGRCALCSMMMEASCEVEEDKKRGIDAKMILGSYDIVAMYTRCRQQSQKKLNILSWFISYVKKNSKQLLQNAFFDLWNFWLPNVHFKI